LVFHWRKELFLKKLTGQCLYLQAVGYAGQVKAGDKSHWKPLRGSNGKSGKKRQKSA
jgi:hypothetical protein